MKSFHRDKCKCNAIIETAISSAVRIFAHEPELLFGLAGFFGVPDMFGSAGMFGSLRFCITFSIQFI